MSEAKELLERVLSTTLNLDKSGVAALFKADGAPVENAYDVITQKHAEHVAALKGDQEALLLEKYNYGLRKGGALVEKAIRSHGVSSDKQGADLVEELVAKIKGEAHKGAEITEDVVKTHPVYRQLEQAHLDHKQSFEQQLEAKLKEQTAEIQRTQTLAKVHDFAIGIAEGMKPVGLPKDLAKRKAFLGPVLQALNSYGYQDHEVNGNKTFLPLKSDGARLEDKHGHQVQLEALIRQHVESTYELEQGDDRSTAGSDNVDASKRRGAAVDLPADEKELSALLDKTLRDRSLSPAERNKIIEGIRERRRK